MGETTRPERATPAERFRLREALAAWNHALDRADLDALATLTAKNATFSFESTRFEGPDALARFVAARAGAGDTVQHTHVNHLQAWRHADGFRTRAMAMIVHMRPDTSPFGDGAPSAAWVGFTEDVVHQAGPGFLIASRRFVRWDRFLDAERVRDGGDAA